MNFFNRVCLRAKNLLAPQERIKEVRIEKLEKELVLVRKEYQDLLVDYCELGNKYLKLIDRSIENGESIIVSKN